MATCDRCFASLEAKTRDEAIASGWHPKHSDTSVSGYGWECPACIGQPPRIPKRGKRRTR